MKALKFIINGEEQEIPQNEINHEITTRNGYENWPKTTWTLYLCAWWASEIDLPNNKVTYILTSSDHVTDYIRIFWDGIYSYIDLMKEEASGLFANTEFARLIMNVFTDIDSAQFNILFDISNGGLNDRYTNWTFISSAMEQFELLYSNPTDEQAEILKTWLNQQNDRIIVNQHAY